jgi:aldehyde dehydrogenase (NAD+)
MAKTKMKTMKPAKTKVTVIAPRLAATTQLSRAYEKPAAKLNFSTKWKYAPAPEATDHVKLNKSYELFIGGKFVEPKSGKYFETLNPSTEKKLADIAEAGEQDVALAVQSARNAYDNVWAKMPAKERGKYLFRIARLIQDRARELCIIESMDGGKPIRESRTVDVPLAAAHFFYYAGWADKLNYAFPGRETHSLGVAGQIIPWNFPLLMAAWKIAPALAAGNTVVLKPAETTPLTALKLAEIMQMADLPPGVVNILTGAGSTGAALVKHPDVNKVAFTGSTEVGKKIAQAIVGTGKKITLELGGKSANIIFEDAPLDQAVEGIVNAIFFNQGHVCCAGSRLFVQESVAKMVVQKLQDRMETLMVGDPLDKNTDIGAINSKSQLDKINSYLESGMQEGAVMYQSNCPVPKGGYWCRPTMFTNVAQSHKVTTEEIFGPVLTVQTFRTVEEAIEKANNTPYGLAGGVWTDKGSKIFKVTNQLRAGVLWANTYNKFDPTSPFGGYKESGMGREGGIQGLMPYLKLS